MTTNATTGVETSRTIQRVRVVMVDVVLAAGSLHAGGLDEAGFSHCTGLAGRPSMRTSK